MGREETRSRGSAVPHGFAPCLLPSPVLFSPVWHSQAYSSFHLQPCPYQRVLNDVEP